MSFLAHFDVIFQLDLEIVGTRACHSVRTTYIDLAHSLHSFSLVLVKRMRFHHGIGGRIGQTVHHIKRAISHVDTGMRVARAVHDEVKKHAGSNRIVAAAEKGITSYEQIRQRIKAAGD